MRKTRVRHGAFVDPTGRPAEVHLELLPGDPLEYAAGTPTVPPPLRLMGTQRSCPLSPAGLPGSLDPGVDVGGVEADEVAPLDVGDAAFVDEAADVADLDAEALGDGGDVDEVGDGLGLGQGWAPGVSVVFFHPPSKRVSATKCDRKLKTSDLTSARPGSRDNSRLHSVRHLPPLSDHHLTLSFDSRCVQTAEPERTRLRPFGREVGRRVGVDADDGGGVGRLSPGDGDGPGGRSSGCGAGLLRVAG